MTKRRSRVRMWLPVLSVFVPVIVAVIALIQNWGAIVIVMEATATAAARQQTPTTPIGLGGVMGGVSLPDVNPTPTDTPPASTEETTAESGEASTEEGANVEPTATQPACAAGQRAALIPAGAFQMGSEGWAMEEPAHTVTLTQGFCIDLYEVQNSEYAVFLNEYGNQMTPDGNPHLDVNDSLLELRNGQWRLRIGYEDHSDHPVTGVTWFGAQAYCEAQGGGLPTEAQWEYAARGNTGSIYPWGNTSPDCANVVFLDTCNLDLRPVGAASGDVSAFGLSDMGGNVHEWVADWFARYSFTALTDPLVTDASSGTRVVRGGSRLSDFNGVRATVRTDKAPGFADFTLGFRCAYP